MKSKFFIFHLFFLFSLFFFLNSSAYSAESSIARSENVAAQLVSEVQTIQPGKPFTLALRMKMDENWHTYWRNGADSGLPTEIKWTLPEGFSAEEMQWPFPEKIDTPPLVTYARQSWGPREADELLACENHAWQMGCIGHHGEDHAA